LVHETDFNPWEFRAFVDGKQYLKTFFQPVFWDFF
jgi:hypothetical protein